MKPDSKQMGVENNDKAPLTGLTVFERYQLGKRLGVGAFGEIYLATNSNDQNEQYAVKAEPANARHPQLIFEAKLYKYLTSQYNPEGFPKVHQYGSEHGHNLMMMDLLGKSLEELFVANRKKFTVKTTLMVGIQLLSRIEYLHSRNFLHRDIKPDNLLMGVAKMSNILYLVDFGLAKKYTKEGKHIPFKEGKELTGTARYASIATHKGLEQSRRDDIESIGYVIMYFLKGQLPWQNLRAYDTKHKYALILKKKETTSLESLCGDNGLVPEMAEFIAYARKLGFEDKPDYAYLRKILLDALARRGLSFDFDYDWVHFAQKNQIGSQKSYPPPPN